MSAEWRTVKWDDLVEFQLPASWAAEVEDHEGHTVAVFLPPAPATGTLRLVTDRVAPKEGPDGVGAVLQEMALRFVRPDDSRASDRIVAPWDNPEARAIGAEEGVVAQAVMATEEDGRAELHYLWMIGVERAGRAAVAMFSFLVPADQDGDPAIAGAIALLDTMIREASIS